MLLAASLSQQAVQPPQQPAYAHSGILDFNSRVWAQEKIERVWYSHRLWPSENPGPKPLFEAVVSNQDLQDAVQSYLAKSNALPEELTVSMLQAELDRLGASTKAPDILLELFAALGNDSYLIAETLGRQTLVQHLYLAAEQAGTLQSGGGLAPPNNPSLPKPVYVMPVIPSDSSCAVWKPVRSGPPVSRNGPTAIWTGVEMIVWGGGTCSSGENTGGRYNPTLDDWLPTNVSDAPAKRALHTAVWAGQGIGMIVWGGCNNGPLNDGARYNPADNSWTTITMANAPAPRLRHTAVWTGQEMIVWGGETHQSLGTPTDTGGVYNPLSGTWIATPYGAGSNVPLARSKHSAVWAGNEMIIWGGANGGNTGGRFIPGGTTWIATSTGGNVPASRNSHTAVWTGSRMIIWGGDLGDSSGGRYNPSDNSWEPTSTANVPVARSNNTAVWTGTEMIIWGGGGLNTGGKYNPVFNSWIATSTGTNVPSGRNNHAAVWDDFRQQMIIWGGNSASGGRYSPASDSWQPTYLGLEVPTPRKGHTAVWTGSEMIVWGGGASGGRSNSGGKYNPVTDSWVTTSTGANVPTARSNHTAVWTGTQHGMIVWGGCGSTGCHLDTGGRYNVANNIWAATNPTDDPACNDPGVTVTDRATGRGNHTAVWSGSEMIIFGGSLDQNSQDLGDLNSWGRYIPGSNQWACRADDDPVPPSKRKAHTAVWTGANMIIWGGNCEDATDAENYCNNTSSGPPVDYNTGSLFNIGDSWADTNIASAPTARHQHTAIWSGSEMIVWGGQNVGGTSLGDGGRYNGSAWTSVTSASAPAARSGHTAVWTGSSSNPANEMIVWGGTSGGNTYLDSGGRYTPDAGTGSWQSTVTGGFSSQARSGHTAVWTGYPNNQMIVWGGTDTSGELSNGGLYSPSGIFISQQPSSIQICPQ